MLRDEAAAIGRRYVDALSNDIQIGGHSLDIGVALGIALFPEDGAGANEILRHADLAMYRAKDARKSDMAFFDAAIDVPRPTRPPKADPPNDGGQKCWLWLSERRC